MTNTVLKYLEDSEQYSDTATVLELRRLPGSPAPVLILDETILYPQGGGQPTDHGVISKQDGKLMVSRVSFVEGEVHHNGTFSGAEFEPGDRVDVEVDGARRQDHARLHTGGHLIMTAVDRLLGLPALKGYHFPDGPYVEFEGVVPTEERERVLGQIQQILDELVAENSEVSARFEKIETLREQGVHIPAEIPADKPTRVVVTAGYQSPCGGTHVKRLGELSGLKARGIKAKSGHTRVSYGFA